VTAVMYRVTDLTCSFVYSRGVQPAVITHNNLPSDTHPLLLFHMQHTNQSTITGVDLCHRKLGHPRFTETCAIQYQPFVSVHNAPFHSQCNTTHKGSNKTCHNNITLPTNKQYLKIHVRNWTWPQTSQRHTNTMQYTRPDKLHTNHQCSM
jgi:hypothetical protein